MMELIANENKTHDASSAGAGRGEGKRFRNVQYALAGIVALATFFVYLPALKNAFVGVWDDNAYIVENAAIRSLNMAFLRWAFLDFHASNWHPLTWISHAVDYALWGLNPLGHHLTSITLHAVNTALVVLLALKLLEIARERAAPNASTSFLNDRTILIAAGVTGLVFGIHPLHVESIAWVAERKDLLCALFFLMSIMMYAKCAGCASGEAPGAESIEQSAKRMAHGVWSRPVALFADRRYLAALGLFILALMGKPMAVTLPAVLLILDWHPFGRIRSLRAAWAACIEKLPFIVLSFAASIVTFFAQRAGESIGSLELMPLSTRLLVAAHSLVAYLGKMMLPLNLVPYYPYPANVSLFSGEYASTLAFVIGVTAASVVLAKKQKVWLSSWGYYVATLIPVLGIVQVGNQSMADRYTYLPSLGLFLIAGLSAAWVMEKMRAFPRWGIIARFASTAGAIVALLFLSSMTVKQTRIWDNGFVLWSHALEKGYESATAYNNRGVSLDERGLREEARADFNRAIALDSRNYFAYNNLGVLYGKDGLFSRSIEYFLKAIALNPEHADSYSNLGLSYFNIHQYEKALENYNRAIDLNPDFDTAYLNRGNLYFIIGNKGLALADYRMACNMGNSRACDALSLLSREL